MKMETNLDNNEQLEVQGGSVYQDVGTA